MKPVKTLPKFKCDFCKRRAVKWVMELHEKRCFRNPNRFCDYCENKGFTHEHIVGDGINEEAYYQDIPCPYCSAKDEQKTKEIDNYYKSLTN
jgi:hypothetical protein